jgi:hypothetical protein
MKTTRARRLRRAALLAGSAVGVAAALLTVDTGGAVASPVSGGGKSDRNIGQFGGDPHNVTIAGQSAGGLSVLAQLRRTTRPTSPRFWACRTRAPQRSRANTRPALHPRSIPSS